MENDILNEKLCIALITSVSLLFNTIENETYEKFNTNKEDYEKMFINAFSFIFCNYIHEVFNLITENKKKEKQKQKSIIDIFLNVYEELKSKYTTEYQKYNKDNESN